MNPSPLAQAADAEHRHELLADAERSRRAQAAVREVTAAAVRPPAERRRAVRAALLRVCGGATVERP
jgi:hypothetical protein